MRPSSSGSPPCRTGGWRLGVRPSARCASRPSSFRSTGWAAGIGCSLEGLDPMARRTPRGSEDSPPTSSPRIGDTKSSRRGLTQALREGQSGAAVVPHRRLDRRHRPSRRGARAWGLLGRLDSITAQAGGVCDSRKTADRDRDAPGDVPALEEWRVVRRRADPAGPMSSTSPPSPSSRSRRISTAPASPGWVAVLGAGSAIAQTSSPPLSTGARPTSCSQPGDRSSSSRGSIAECPGPRDLARVSAIRRCDIAAHAGFLQGIWSDKRRFHLALV